MAEQLGADKFAEQRHKVEVGIDQAGVLCDTFSLILTEGQTGSQPMWDGLDKLLELQKLDLAIARLDVEAREIPQQIEALQARLTGAKAGLDHAKSTAELIQKDRRAKERELDEVTQNIKKKQARLFEIKTNEEYSAVLKEIESLKEKSSKLETEVLELLERADAVAKTVAEAEKEFKAAEAIHQRERTEKEAQLGKLKQDLASLKEARKSQASRLDSALLQQYTRLAKTRGNAVVSVKDGSCTGCGIALTPQAYNEVRRNDRMFNCSSCNRILYFAG
jgi:predicted  nucleic acid-binding Zn-ribbon protein